MTNSWLRAPSFVTVPPSESPSLVIDPFARFDTEFQLARTAGILQPEAMALATVDRSGVPSVRMVLLKSVDSRGFVFYTNLRSPKAIDILGHPAVSLCFFWEPIQRQVRVQGLATTVTPAEADEYFSTRPRGSQIGAWASHQSQVLDRRESLLQAVATIEDRYANLPIPRPPHWSGFRVVPSSIEFWHGQPSRLHLRELYTRTADGWHTHLLQP